MSTRIPETDLQALWQNLETETTTMSAQQMSIKTQEFLRKTRRDLIARSAFAVIAAAFCGIVFMSTRMSIGLIAGVVMVMLLASTARNLYVFYRRSHAASAQSGTSASWSSCVEFYRTELERRRQIAMQPAWQLAAALLIIAWLSRRSLYSGHDALRVLLPAVLLAAAGLIVWMAVRKFQARHVQNDLDALNRFEKESPSGGEK
jgi:hypothetical protein